MLLLVLVLLDAAEDRHLDRLHEHQLAPRVVEHRPSEVRLLLEDDVRQAVLPGGRRGGQAGRARADDHEVDHVSPAAAACRGRELGDPLDGRLRLADRVLHEREAAQLSGHEQAGHREALLELVELRDVLARADVAETDLDRADRARDLAAAVADAAQAVDHAGRPARRRPARRPRDTPRRTSRSRCSASRRRTGTARWRGWCRAGSPLPAAPGRPCAACGTRARTGSRSPTRPAADSAQVR